MESTYWRNAMKALPHLVACAEQGRTITYKELSKLTGLHYHTIIPSVLGCIRDEICIPRELPIINAIVVSSSDGIPGVSFMPVGTKGLSREERRALAREKQEEVFGFPDWRGLLSDYSLEPVTVTPEIIEASINRYLNRFGDREGVGESKLHEDLKVYVASHPELFYVVNVNEEPEEFKFASGDRCDVIFMDEDPQKGGIVIEVKKGPELGELGKGVFQAIKYRALLAAEKGRGKPYSVRAYLVAYNIPPEIIDYAALFDIICLKISEDDVERFCGK